MNAQGLIGDLLIKSNSFTFIAPDFLRHEVHARYDKLLKLSRLSLSSIQETEYQVCKNIKFVSDKIISSQTWQFAIGIALGIDPKDIIYVAYTISSMAISG